MLYAICYTWDDEEGGAVLAQAAEAVYMLYMLCLFVESS